MTIGTMMIGQRQLRAMMQWMWRQTPGDAQAVILVASLMPLFMMAYKLGWDIASARIGFGVCIAVLTSAIASLIGKRTPHNVPLAFDYLAWGLCAVGVVVVFLTPVMDLDPVAWRIVAGTAQGLMVGAWFTLWRLRRRWLSRTIAARATLAAGLGLALFVVSNFLIADPLTALAEWGVELPRGVIGRTLAPIVEILPALVLYGLIIPPWLKYLRGRSEAV